MNGVTYDVLLCLHGIYRSILFMYNLVLVVGLPITNLYEYLCNPLVRI